MPANTKHTETLKTVRNTMISFWENLYLKEKFGEVDEKLKKDEALAWEIISLLGELSDSIENERK